MGDIIKLNREPLSYEITEELNTLRTNVIFAGSDVKTIMLTSCLADEGKSITAMNLAVSLTELGKKVFFVDCDFRKSVLRQQADMPKKWYGFTHYLTGQCAFSDALYQTNISNLYVIFAGQVPPSPTKLLSSDLFGKTMKAMRNSVDYVIVDTPPIGMVVDAAIIGQHCDAGILLLESGNIRYENAREAKEKIENVGCQLLGVVLNKVDRAKAGYYYGKKYQKYYKNKYYRYENKADN